MPPIIFNIHSMYVCLKGNEGPQLMMRFRAITHVQKHDFYTNCYVYLVTKSNDELNSILT